MFLIAIWSGLRPPKLTPWSRGPKRGAQWVSGASAVHFGGHFIKQKLLGTPNLVGVSLLMDLDLEGPGPHVLLEPWSLTFKERF